MNCRIVSPYENAPASQFKGNLHTHTTNSDGPLPPQETIAAYAHRGYDFLMISDHDFITDVSAFDNCGMTLVPGNEITDRGMHMLHVNAAVKVEPYPARQRVIDAINGLPDSLCILNHPNWGKRFVHSTQEEIEALNGFIGIEIYNGVSLRVEGSALATERWDMLLSRGRRVWGFGNDDGHIPEDYGIAWNMIFAEECTVPAIMDALRKGQFYVSTGVQIDAIEIGDAGIYICSRDTDCFRVYGDHGMMLASIEGNELNYDLSVRSKPTYLRVECHGRGARMAWTQPFFLT